MLRGIPDIIGSDLLKALADTGHGDIIVIADHFYPPNTKTPNGISIQAKGTTTAQMVDAILKLVPLDVEYCEHPIAHMIPDPDSAVKMDHSKVWEDTLKLSCRPLRWMAARVKITTCSRPRQILSMRQYTVLGV